MTIEFEVNTMLIPDPRMRLQPGDVTLAWCSKTGDRERKLYTGYSLVCLHCHPERDPNRDEQWPTQTV